mmetsp:Transcript_84223/g.225150  ORF Transcript_84223/g.225150 Transcript_84223/m.225150 type:complete len:98 (-) Transcript_84223:176-469(-)
MPWLFLVNLIIDSPLESSKLSLPKSTRLGLHLINHGSFYVRCSAALGIITPEALYRHAGWDAQNELLSTRTMKRNRFALLTIFNSAMQHIGFKKNGI